MYVCKGKVVGVKKYLKDGEQQFYYQINYESKLTGYEGLRACACKGYNTYKIGDVVKVADDFARPQIIEE